MLAERTFQQLEAPPPDLVVCDLQHQGDWLMRVCPECHCVGYVGIDPRNPNDAANYITRADWVCKTCEDIRREVDRNFYGRGGDLSDG